MGVRISKRSGGGGSTSGSSSGSSSGPAVGKLQYRMALSSYEEACRVDPDIETFDAGLHQRTSRVISNLAVNGQLRSLSFDVLREVTGNLLEMNQDVVRIILDCKKDIWRNPELFDLVEAYFENSLYTLDFCTALEKCLMNARDSQLIVHLALKSFEEEDAVLPSAEDDDKSTETKGKAKYTRTLEELRRFKAIGDPFKEEFFQAFQSVYRQHWSMLEKLQHRKNKLDKKLKSVRAWRKVTCVLFGSAFAALIICSVVAALVAAPPIAAAVAAASSIPLGSMGKWFDSMWKEYQSVLMTEKDLIGAMQAGNFLVMADLDSIRVLINQLEDHISSMLESAEFAFREEEAVRFGVDQIGKKLVEFMKSIEDLAKQADRCSRDIKWARTVVLQKIVRYP